MLKKKLLGFIPIECFDKFCMDEITGLIAIILGVVAYILQFKYSEQSLDLKSFSIIALFFTAFGEFFFMIQGIQKKSITIALTRTATFLAFSSFIVLWFISKRKEKKESLQNK